MAVVKNVTKGALTLGVGGPPVYAGDEVTVRDERVVGRAFPKSTWGVVEPPEGCVDVGPDDAHVFQPAPDPEPFTAPNGGEDPDPDEEQS